MKAIDRMNKILDQANGMEDEEGSIVEVNWEESIPHISIPAHPSGGVMKRILQSKRMRRK